jgi:Autophagy protein ATG9
VLLFVLQRTTRLCIVRDLSEHDIVARIMRKENYLLGMINKVGNAISHHTGSLGLVLRAVACLQYTLGNGLGAKQLCIELL